MINITPQVRNSLVVRMLDCQTKRSRVQIPVTVEISFPISVPAKMHNKPYTLIQKIRWLASRHHMPRLSEIK